MPDFLVGDVPYAPAFADALLQDWLKADFLAMFDRILPEEYLRPMKERAGPGYEIWQGIAKLGERLSLAVGRQRAATYVLTATSGVLATVNVEFYRGTSAAGAVTIKKGTVVTTSRGGRDFVTTADTTLTANGSLTDLASGPVPAQAVVPSYQWNVPGQLTVAQGALAGAIDTVKYPSQASTSGDPYADASVMVRQPTGYAGAVGGTPPVLDQLGADRGVPRAPGESDNLYRGRVRSLPDTVSPLAIKRVLTAALTSRGILWTLVEGWQTQGCLADATTGPTDPPDDNSACFDDPRVPAPFISQFGSNAVRSSVIVVLSFLPTFDERGVAFDDASVPFTDRQTFYGQRAANAFDIPPVSNIDAGALDGPDVAKQNEYARVFDLLSATTAGGITVILELQPQ